MVDSMDDYAKIMQMQKAFLASVRAFSTKGLATYQTFADHSQAGKRKGETPKDRPHKRDLCKAFYMD
jgi:hypothetical protein